MENLLYSSSAAVYDMFFDTPDMERAGLVAPLIGGNTGRAFSVSIASY
jgi:hypothetical protein